MLDLTGKIQTREGFQVRILADDIKGLKPIVGAVMLGDGLSEIVARWDKNGKFIDRCDHPYDLVNVKDEGWVIVRKCPRFTLDPEDGDTGYRAGIIFDTEDHAKAYASKGTKVIKIEW